jgi:hypothetical protein
MKKEILKQFEELNQLVELEIKDIASKLLENHETYEEALTTLVDYYESETKIEDLIYSEIYKKMVKQATK